MTNPLIPIWQVESDAYPDNVIRVEVLLDGTSQTTIFNSKGEQMAQSFRSPVERIGRA